MRGLLIILLVVALMVGCGHTKKEQQQQSQLDKEKPVTLNISAAASLTDSLEEIKALYIATHPSVEINYNFGGSGALQQQIEQGAPADLFISAGKKQMSVLIDAGLMLEGSVKELLENKVVLIMPKDSEAITLFEDLTQDRVTKIAVGEPGSVPVGQYTEEIFNSLRLTEQLSGKIVQAKDVREVLSWVETGNVDAGVVYETDAKISDKVIVCATAPEGSHKLVIYPVGIVKASSVSAAAEEFMEFLFSDIAKQVLIKYGFSPLF